MTCPQLTCLCEHFWIIFEYLWRIHNVLFMCTVVGFFWNNIWPTLVLQLYTPIATLRQHIFEDLQYIVFHRHFLNSQVGSRHMFPIQGVLPGFPWLLRAKSETAQRDKSHVQHHELVGKFLTKKQQFQHQGKREVLHNEAIEGKLPRVPFYSILQNPGLWWRETDIGNVMVYSDYQTSTGFNIQISATYKPLISSVTEV